MGSCLVHRSGAMFKAWINVQANPNVTITATGSKKTYTAVANATTGIASILIKKKDAYKITSDCGASYEAANNTTTVNVTKNKQTYTAQKVKLNAGYTSFAVRNDYGSNTLIAYWNGSKPSSYCTNYYVEEVTSSGYVGKYTGTGTSYTINTSTTVNGYKETVTSGTLKAYVLSAFITINGKNYYGNIMTASGTAKTYSSYSTNVTSSQTLTVPAGCKSITAFVVGGGGKGGNSNESWASLFYYVSNQRLSYSGGGGGGGGYTATKTISCTPGQSISCVVGASASNSSVTVNGTTCTASKGNNGSNGNAYQNVDKSGSTYEDKSDGGAGGVGNGNGGQGAGRVSTGSTRLPDSAAGSAGSNGYGGGGGGGGSISYYIPTSGTSSMHWNIHKSAVGKVGGSPSGGAGGSLSLGASYPVAGTANSGGGGGGGSFYGSPANGDNDSRGTLVATSGANGGSGFVKLTYNF